MRRYISALVLVALLATTAYTTLMIVMEAEQDSATIVNVSGRQRMLSQRIALFINKIQVRPDDMDAIDAAERTVDLFERSHQALVNGSPEMGLPGVAGGPAHAIYFGPKALDLLTERYIERARDALTSLRNGTQLSPEKLERLYREADTILPRLDEAVKIFEAEGKANVDRMIRIETAVFISTLVLLIIEALFIFQPTVRKIYEALRSYRKASKVSIRAAQDRKLLIDTVSHELRTPMNRLFHALAQVDRDELPPNQREHIEEISAASTDIMETVGAVLNFVSLEENKQKFLTAPVDVPDLIERVMGNEQRQADEKGLRFYSQLNVDSEGFMPRLMLEHDQVTMVLKKLVNNAVRYTDKGRVIVEYGFSPSHSDDSHGLLKITVLDTGAGIHRDRIKEIFTPFSGAGRTGDADRGLGLGLNIALNAVKRMGGTIEVKSQLGEGSAFSLSIPTQIAQSKQSMLTEAPAAASLDCLIAEDNPVNQLILSKILKEEGHKVTAVADGEAAIEAIGQKAFDAILLDIIMPKKRGDEACREIKDKLRENCPPLIAVTANATPDDIAGYHEAGFDCVVPKPISAMMIRQALDQTS